MQLLRYILFPLGPIYYLISWFRNKLYDHGVFSSKQFNLPIICIGNLSTGGTGKSPMTEYLIRLLQTQYKIAVLSRGYRRKTKGFQLSSSDSRVEDLGDEPFQIHSKFNDLIVAVDNDRVHGVEQLLLMEETPDVILLDDGFQHRQIKAGLNILLTAYDKLYVNDIVLPAGNLREPISGAKRAKIVVITKCPNHITEQEKMRIKNQLDKGYEQSFYFSSIRYSDKVLNSQGSKPINEFINAEFTLVTGIANAKPLVAYLQSLGANFKHLEFKDHHAFTRQELDVINQQELILTTEKDYVRMFDDFPSDSLYYLSIEHVIHNKAAFERQVLDFCQYYSMGAAEL